MLECLTDRVTTLDDAVSFEKALACTNGSRLGALGYRFAKKKPIFVVRAPARLDCMGGIADYSGSLVCEMTLDRAVILGIQARDDRKVVIHSSGVGYLGLTPDVTLSLDLLAPDPSPPDYLSLRQELGREPGKAWAAYVGGAFSVLHGEGFIDRFPHGATIVLVSNIPPRVGISSSAALEIAAMYGLSLLYGIKLDGLSLANLSHKVENHVVGAACGIMDQVTCALGKGNQLLSLLCQPHTVREHLPVPPGLHLIGINSGIRRQIKSARYSNTRIGTFIGLAIIQNYIKTLPGVLHNSYSDYLCNISPIEFVNCYRRLLPSSITGRDFKQRYGDTPDTATTVAPEVSYKVRSRVEHPIYEHQRVRDFTNHIRLANNTGETGHLRDLGRLMFSSDWSYTYRCGLGSSETAWIVNEIRKLGPAAGFYGAKITGGGAGGTVAVAGTERMFEHLEDLLKCYRETTGIVAELFKDTSPGALEFGHVVYRLT